MRDCVALAIACLTLNPEDPQDVRKFESTMKMCLAPGLDQASRDYAEKRKQTWRQYWRETWEAPEFTILQKV